MGGLPTQNEIDSRGRQAQEKLARLKAAHDDFIAQWERIMEEEKHLVASLHEYVDTAKMEHMLSIIKNIKD